MKKPLLIERNQFIKILTAVFVLLQIPLWIGSGSIFSLLYVYYKQYDFIQDNDKLTLANQQLMDKVAALKNGPDEIEARARFELALVGKDETYYQVIQK